MMRSPEDRAAFHAELRERNVPIFKWSAAIFNIVYLAWTGFDWVLAPAHLRSFFLLRLAASSINTVLVLVVLNTRLRKYSWEAFWLFVAIFGAFTTPMLSKVGAAFLPYVVGFSIVLFGGVIAFWPPRYSVTLSLAVSAMGILGFIVDPGNTPADQLAPAGMLLATIIVILGLVAWNKYDFLQREFAARKDLGLAVRRESEARARLAATTTDLEQALQRLKENDSRKNTFFANVSHELRTPLTLILAPVDELLERAGEDMYKPLATVRRNAERLLRLIDDLLDLSRLDAGGLRLTLAEVDIRTVAQVVAENAMPAAKAKKVALTFSSDTAKQRSWGDSHRLEIILTNLIGNAVKYTPRGGSIAIDVRDESDEVVARVKDDGPGIASEDLSRVFDRFFQAGKNDRRSQGGVGIGLALARELTELHGGKLEVESTVGQGTTFILRLPFGKEHIKPDAIERRQRATGVRLGRRAEDMVQPTSGETPSNPDLPAMIKSAAASPPEFAPVSPSGRRARVLVVDDNDELRRFMIELLSREHDVIAAHDGREALGEIERQMPDIVVSDVMMPVMSGVELCQVIKSNPSLKGLPVILLTARAGADATLEGYAHGADDFVAKPFHPRVLEARVRAQLRLRELGVELAQKEKLAAVGTLAAGVLHEVRNPVNAILNAARVLMSEPRTPLPQEKKLKLLGLIADGGERIQGITKILDEHTRPADGGLSATADLKAGLESTLRLLEHRLDGVTIERDYATRRLAIAPAGPINQVLLNLIDNALKAGAHRLKLVVQNPAPEVGSSDQVLARVGDDGPGIAPDARNRIFDPFVTGGNGSGLGLYVSRRIVEQHRGRIWCEAREGGGTWFNILLPGVDDQGREDASPESKGAVETAG